jgi:DNA-binding GntR family transcriptional regulator
MAATSARLDGWPREDPPLDRLRPNAARPAPAAEADVPAPRRAARRDCRVLFTRDQPKRAPTVKPEPLPKQIADHLGHRVLRAEFRAGTRLKEIELAAFYRVSRGPIREALRLLERRGLVEVVPRHGARVRSFDMSEVSAIFSIRAVLFGLAAREAARHQAPDLVPRVGEYVVALKTSARDMRMSPLEHATLSGEAQRVIAQRSGSAALAAMLEDLNGRAFWRMIWNEAPLDFVDRRRRQESARFWSGLLLALRSGDGDGAETAARALLDASRNHTLAKMREAMGASETIAAAPPTPYLPLKGGGSRSDAISSPPPLRGGYGRESGHGEGGVAPLASNPGR